MIDMDLTWWTDRAREKLLMGKRRCASCGSGSTRKASYNRQSSVICNRCGAVIRRLTVLEPTYIELIG